MQATNGSHSIMVDLTRLLHSRLATWDNSKKAELPS
jgi:hypothetical protein